MATANASPSPGAPPSRRARWLRRALLAALFVAGALLALYWTPLRQTALTAASAGARMACSCHYVAGRPLGQCRSDFEPRMGLVLLSSGDDAKSVTARLPLLASQTAFYREGVGCQLEKWPE
jgi:hypothetical protein